MISWIPQQVGAFLGCEPHIPHSENTEYRFGFRLRGMFASLTVRPFDEEIWLTLSSGLTAEHFAEWRHRCRDISVVSDPAIDLEHALILELRASGLRQWIRIEKENGAFTIGSYSLAT